MRWGGWPLTGTRSAGTSWRQEIKGAAGAAGAVAAGPRGACSQTRPVQRGARLGRGAEQAVRPGHRDEDSGEFPPRESQGKEMSEHVILSHATC